jgi:toxin ParE1/3/4
MGIKWTQTARDDLFKLADFLDAQQPDRGNLFLSEVGAAIGRLDQFPKSGSPIGDGIRRKHSVRRFPALVLYRTDGTDIFVLRIVHNRSEWQTLL